MYYIGIDVGGTNLKAGLVDESYKIVATKKMPLEFESMEQMGQVLAQMALDLVTENGISRDEVACVGMGFPGPVDNKAGVVIKTVNIPIRFMPVAEIFHRYWDVPVYLGNDADCA
ncbi:MAG: ROK family protein, partial [Oscillospiraceae bacterium]|nr:ROK family protein [Oscillospiraceae bacterium]